MTRIPAPSRTLVAPVASAVLLALLAGTLHSSATAQQVTERQTAFESLSDSQWIRLKVPHVAGRYEGRLIQRGPDHLVLSADPEPLRVPATTIDTLWTRGNAGVTGAVVGGLFFGALGAALGASAVGESTEDVTKAEGALIVGGVGLAGGAVLGGLIGLFTHKWNRRYP